MNPALSCYLDALRLSAAVLVFAHHASYPRFDGSWIAALGGFGHEAVVIFFVLSGYVIAFVSHKKEGTPAAYAVSRLARLWSVVIPAVLATLLMDKVGAELSPSTYAEVESTPYGALAVTTFTNEFWFFGRQVGSNIPVWSLSYEAAYYFIFGAFLFAPNRWLTVLACAALVGPKILLLAPAWLSGVFAYYSTQKSRSTRVNAFYVAAGAIIALTIAMTNLGNRYITWRWEYWLGAEAFNAMGHAASFVSDNAIAVAFSAHLVGMAGLLAGAPVRDRQRALIARASLVTFPLYLFHYPSLYFFSALSTAILDRRVGWLIGGASFLVSALMTPLCERLRTRLRRNIQTIFSTSLAVSLVVKARLGL